MRVNGMRRVHEPLAHVLRAEMAGVGLCLVALTTACGSVDPEPAFDPTDAGLEVPFDTCAVTESTDPERALVSINEVFAGSLYDDARDWIELHNAGDTAVDLTGWTIEDRYTGDDTKPVPGRFTFPSNTLLCPGAYHVVERDLGCEVDALEFGLGSTDQLLLARPDGTIVDDVYWANLPRDQSMGLAHDAPGEFRRLATPTIGYPNSEFCECCGECKIGKCVAHDGVCVAESETDCEESAACMQLGWCGLVDGECRPTEEAHCRIATTCADKGRCGLVGEDCAVVASDDCRNAKVCSNEGRCTADLDNATCIATSSDDCEASDDCFNVKKNETIVRKGRCTLSEGRCVATSCEDTTVCQEKMCCTLLDGKCVKPHTETN
jgi:hypothetical protein